MPCDRDAYFTLAESRIEAALIPGARLELISSDHGHVAGAPGRLPEGRGVVQLDAAELARGPLEQRLHRLWPESLPGLRDRRLRRDPPAVVPGTEFAQITDQPKHHLSVRLREEQPHRDHVTDHHVRRQPPRPLLPPRRAIENLLKQVAAKPGRHHTQPDMIGQPTPHLCLPHR